MTVEFVCGYKMPVWSHTCLQKAQSLTVQGRAQPMGTIQACFAPRSGTPEVPVISLEWSGDSAYILFMYSALDTRGIEGVP